MKKNKGGDVFTSKESTELLRFIATNMVTHEDLDTVLENKFSSFRIDFRTEIQQEIRQSEQRVMDYTDKRVTEAEGKIIGIVRKEDEKIDAVVQSAEERKLFDRKESNRLQELGAFPKLLRV
jgi:uncharacterized protein (DUF1800 family)